MFIISDKTRELGGKMQKGFGVLRDKELKLGDGKASHTLVEMGGAKNFCKTVFEKSFSRRSGDHDSKGGPAVVSICRSTHLRLVCLL